MADIKGLGGLSTSGGTNKLIAAYSNDLVDVDSNTGFGINISSSNNAEFESYLDSLFFQNFDHTPLSFDGTDWTTKHVAHVPKAKYIKQFAERLFLGYIKINSTEYASRVWYSNLPEFDKQGNLSIQWGFQSGTNGSVTKNTNRFRAANAGFKTYGLKVGDPLVIESGANAGQYKIARISDDQMVEIVGEFTSSQSSITYWSGSNWFDVRTNNSDTLKGFSEGSNNLLIYKQDTLHRFNFSSLKTVRGPGTSSNRSIAYFPQRDINIYFHGSSADRTGFYMDDGRQNVNISRAIQPFIDGITAGNYGSVIAWPEGEVYRAYVGTLTNQNSSNDAYNISESNVVLSYSIPDNAWSVDPIADTIKARALLRESGALKTFIGNDNGQVFQTPSGHDFNNSPIRFGYQTRPIYPRGSEMINNFTRVEVVARDAGRVEVYYKLWGNPFHVDQTWKGLGNLKNDITHFDIPQNHRKAAGIQLWFAEIGSREPVPTIEKVTVYSVADVIEKAEKGRET